MHSPNPSQGIEPDPDKDLGTMGVLMHWKVQFCDTSRKVYRSQNCNGAKQSDTIKLYHFL